MRVTVKGLAVVVAKLLAIAIAIILAREHVATLVTMVVLVLATDVNKVVCN